MIKLSRFFRELFDSPATQPLLTLWVIGGLTASMRAAGWINLPIAFLIMTVTLVILVLSAFHKELSELHKKVDSTTDQLVQELHDTVDLTKDQLVQEVHDVVDSTKDVYINRIIQLTAVLLANKIEVPSDPSELQGEPDE